MSKEAILRYKDKDIANLGIYSQFENMPGNGIETIEKEIYKDIEEATNEVKIELIAWASYSAGVLDKLSGTEYKLTEKTLASIGENITEIVDYLKDEAIQTGKRLIILKLLENENIKIDSHS